MLQAVKKMIMLMADGTQISGNNSRGRGGQKLFFCENTWLQPVQTTKNLVVKVLMLGGMTK